MEKKLVFLLEFYGVKNLVFNLKKCHFSGQYFNDYEFDQKSGLLLAFFCDFVIDDYRFVIRHLPTLKVFVYGLFFWTIVKLYISFRVTQHIGLISATYFQNSTMYPPNSMVLLFNSQRSWWPQKSMICESISNDKEWQKDLARVRHAHLPNFVCSWTPYIAVCQVTSEMTKFMISDTNSRSKPVPVSFLSQNPRNFI